jgi:YVTN family beta-propeller protein
MNSIARFRPFTFALACALAVAASAAPAEDTASASGASDSKEYVYIENTNSGTVSVVSIPEHEVVSTIEIGPLLDDVEISSDGRVLYVNRMQSMGHPLSEGIADSGEIIAISTETEEELWRAPTDGWPHHPTLSADDRLLFVPLYDEMYIEIFDTEERKSVGKFPAMIGSHGMKLSPDGKRLYVGSMMVDLLIVYDLENDYAPVGMLPFRDAVRPFWFTKDETTIYVQQSWMHGFLVVDMETGEQRAIALPDLPEGTETPEVYPHTWNHGIALTPDETLLFANGSAADYVAVYSHPDLQLIRTIPVGDDPNWIDFDEAGRFAYISNRGSDDLSIIDVETLEEIKRLPLGAYPQRLEVARVPKQRD